MRELILAVAATLVIPGAFAQEKKGMEMKDMDKMHGAMHEKVEKKATAKDAARKGRAAKNDEAAKKDDAAKKDAHGH